MNQVQQPESIPQEPVCPVCHSKNVRKAELVFSEKAAATASRGYAWAAIGFLAGILPGLFLYVLTWLIDRRLRSAAKLAGAQNLWLCGACGAVFSPGGRQVETQPEVTEEEVYQGPDMNCYFHRDRAAIGICVNCGHPICAGCAIAVGDRLYCKQCVSTALATRKAKIPELRQPSLPAKARRERFPWNPMIAYAGILPGFPALFILAANYLRMKNTVEASLVLALVPVILAIDLVVWPAWWWALLVNGAIGFALIWVQQGHMEDWKRQNPELSWDSPWNAVLAGVAGLLPVVAYFLIAILYVS